METVLIIKTGATGDVVRTTCLLRALSAKVTWLTSARCQPLFPDHQDDLELCFIEDDLSQLAKRKFDRVISLEEDIRCAHFASRVSVTELTGIYAQDNKIAYTASSAHWFDMSRVSVLGREKANELKRANKDCWQLHLFRMIGREFSGERYQVFEFPPLANGPCIGIETRSGDQWPDKHWHGYEELATRLQRRGINFTFFQQRDNLRDYLRDIANCSHIVSGDTLAMHIALAYGKPCTAIFNCTSPAEIFDYGLLKKVVSPLLDKFFYATTRDREVIESVPVEWVEATIVG